MTDYTQITSFGPKDALSTGDPNKKIVGSQFDAEFEAIETAVASKYDSEADVTQHQAALTILESQITDSTILARVAANETISGIWAFNGGTSGASAPFTCDSTYVVTNFNADLLDDQQGSYYLSRANHTGTQAAGTITGLAASATTDTTNANNISSGNLALARMNANALRHNTAFGSAVVYVDTGAPSGGSNGDIWLKY